MDIMSNFSENLKDKIFTSNMSVKQFCKHANIQSPTIYSYLVSRRMPNVDMLTKIADALKTNCDFLLGLYDEENLNFIGKHHSATKFNNRYKKLLENHSTTSYQVAKDLNISRSNFTRYEKLNLFPSSEMLYLLADYFGCSIEYLIGRSEQL